MGKPGKRRNSSAHNSTRKKQKKKNQKRDLKAELLETLKEKPSEPSFLSIHYDFIDLIKSPLDPHHYQLIRLPNQLRACVLSTLDHRQLTYILNPRTFCHEEVEDFNRKFVQLGQNLGPDGDQRSLLATVTNYPWRRSVDEIVDSGSSYDHGSTTSWERMSKYRKMDVRPKSLPGPQCCGISICVGAGSLHDPPQFPGMAHLCEHCVFEGTKKFANAWSVLEENCLYVNAYTGKERTVYYARVDKMEKLPLVMSVFADMMAAPLLSDEIIAREILSVDSETAMRQSNDIIRLYDLFCYMAKKGHPIGRYHAGDASTLRKPQVFNALRQWHKRHYHAANMIVSIQGPLPTQVLVRLLAKYFRQLKAQPMKDEIRPMGFPFQRDQFNKIYKVYPYDDLQWLAITWALPGEYWENHDTKPLDYISMLLGHRGEGSVHKYLWDKGYINNSACCSTSASHSYVRSRLYSSVAVLFELTDAGFEHSSEVVFAVFTYLKMLRKVGPKRRIFDEMRQVNANSFHYEVDAFCDFRKIGEAVHLVEQNPAVALPAATLITKYDPSAIRHALNWLSTETMNIIFVSRSFEQQVSQKHPNILTEFGVFNINPQLVSDIETAIDVFGHFELPKPNRFVTHDACRPLTYHVGKMETDLCISYLHTSGKAALVATHETASPGYPPTAWYTFMFSSSQCPGGNAANAVMANLWSDLLNEAIKSRFYDAVLADFYFGTSASENGLFLYIHGVSRFLPDLWLGILDEIKNFRLERQRFQDFKAFHIQMYGNSARDVLVLANDLALYITSTRYTMLTDMRHVLKMHVKYEDLIAFVTRFKSRLWICAQMFGSITNTHVKTVANSIAALQYDPLGPHDLCKNYTYVLPQGEKCLRVKSYSSKCYTSVIINVYQAGKLNEYNARMCKILTKALSSHIFRDLRTEQQLGYLVWTMYEESYGVSSVKVIIQFQADRFTPGYVDERIDSSFVSFYGKYLHTDQSILEMLSSPLLEKIIETAAEPDAKFGINEDSEEGDGVRDPSQVPKPAETPPPTEPSKIRTFYRAVFPSEQKHVESSGGIPPYRKLSVQVVGSRRDEKSKPLEAHYEGNKRNLYEGLSKKLIRENKGIEPVYAGLTLDLPVDLRHENAYFLTDWFEFKNSMLLYPNDGDHMNARKC